MDDPTWLDYAGLVFNVLATAAGLFGLFLAIKAYRIGVKAYEVSAESYRVAKDQGRRTLELQILRELLALTLDEEAIDDLLEEPNVAFGRLGVRVQLALLPASELMIWRELSRFAELPRAVEIAPQYAMSLAVIPAHRRREYEKSLIANCLRRDIYDAVRQRVE
ncbi:hypothetical protein [Micromonospora sp. DT62]|uniref:hypothetical protein n=1 Tax=Micromonospora sp. DT62 TaxID=3416521 RepID=UPI003CF0005A